MECEFIDREGSGRTLFSAGWTLSGGLVMATAPEASTTTVICTLATTSLLLREAGQDSHKTRACPRHWGNVGGGGAPALVQYGVGHDEALFDAFPESRPVLRGLEFSHVEGHGRVSGDDLGGQPDVRL